MRRSGDIRARAEASAIGGKWRRRGISQEDDHGLTLKINEFGVHEPNSAEIGLAAFEKRSYGRTHRQTDRQTDRQTPLLYIYTSSNARLRPGDNPCQVLHSAAVGSGGETGRLFIGIIAESI